MARPELDPAINILQINEEAHYMRRPEYFDSREYAESQAEADACEAAIKILWAVELGELDVSHLFKEEE
jgi:hypothetical protein